MGRINGIGTAHLGVEARQPDDTVWATLWVTVLFLPIVPLRRERLQLFPHHGTGYACRVLERSALAPRSVLKTIVFSWIVVPLLVAAPAALLVSEVWIEQLGFSQGHQSIAIGVWIAWLVVWTWGLADFHERRFRPRAG